MFLDMSEDFDRIFETYSDEHTTEWQLRLHEFWITVWSDALSRVTDPEKREKIEEDLLVHRLIRIYLLGLLHGEGGRQARLQIINGGARKSGPRP